ncbi:MAG: DUF4358 domain-containing protein [Angelakisella sp.]|jgi:hypothetical protein|nr:DUF4358 domain-containing protein [Angelakisella sp.]
MLKRIFSAAMAAILLLAVTACGAPKEPAAPALKEGVTLKQVIDQVYENYPVAMAAEMDESVVTDLLGLSTDDVEDYAGYITMVMVSSDNLIGIKAKEGKVETVQKALEARKEMVVQSFEQYLPTELDKAKAGKVVTLGDYVFLIIVSNADMDEEDVTAGITKAEELIRGNFDNLA